MKQMITLYADNGKILKYGENYGTTIQLAEGKTAEGITEIAIEEYEEIIAKKTETN